LAFPFRREIDTDDNGWAARSGGAMAWSGEQIVMTFIIQFIRTRRGARVVIRTISLEASDSSAALAHTTSLIGSSRWPANTDAVRVMDDAGRTLLDWSMPVPDRHTAAPSPCPAEDGRIESSTSPASRSPASGPTRVVDPPRVEHPRLEVGQAISYAEDGLPQIWKGGYEIAAEADRDAGETQYAIRSVGETRDRIVKSHELREDLSARTRGR
jgi:hypothetical protein